MTDETSEPTSTVSTDMEGGYLSTSAYHELKCPHCGGAMGASVNSSAVLSTVAPACTD